MNTVNIEDYEESQGICDWCDTGSVATLRIDGDRYCLKCLAEHLKDKSLTGLVMFQNDNLRCENCGDTLDDGDDVRCLSCGNHEECCRGDDCHDECNRGCTNCGTDSPERCEKCLLCSSCDAPLDEEIDNGKAALMHEACFEEVKRDAETLVAAEPTDQYEVTW